MIFPANEMAIYALETAEKMNPGPWTAHCYNVAKAARLNAEACGDLDRDKAFMCGLLHDMGRRTGIAAVRHIIGGCQRILHFGEEIYRHRTTVRHIPLFD